MPVFFSVVIPTLNEEAYLPQLLSCLAAQTYKHFEVIVVDANSEDKTIQYSYKFKALLSAFRVYSTSKGNVSKQRNIGAKKAKGKYLLFLDADSLIPANFLSGIFTAIETFGYELMTTYLIPPDDDIKKNIIVITANVGLELAALLGKPTAGGFNIIIKRSVFETVGGFDEQIIYAEDYEFIDRCLKNGVQLQVLRKPALTYSFRRYEKDGYLTVLGRWTKGSLHASLRGKITKPIFDYPMGGHRYKKRNSI